METPMNTDVMGGEGLPTDPPSQKPIENLALTKTPTPQAPKPGLAIIKSEFIDHNHVRQLVTEYLPPSALVSIKESNDNNTENDKSDEPPAKKAKIKGRNKHRPREKRAANSDRLCSAITQKRECQFGERCKFLHDVKAYMEKKPADLGDACYLFRTYGWCRYGLTCRFAKDHTTEDMGTVEDEDRKKKYEDLVTVSNLIDKDLQRKLWKRNYNFKKAEQSFHAMKAEVDSRREGATGSKTTSESDTVTKVAEDVIPEVKGTPELGDKSEVKNISEIKDIRLPEDGTVANVKDISDVKTALTDIDFTLTDVKFAPTGQTNHPIVKTQLLEKVVKKWGPLGESVIRLRPEERKQIDFSDKLYLAPLTTVGNLPFRRVCKAYGADVTCGEMALATNLLQGQQSEWALLKRHESEDLFGAQVCGSYPDTMSRCAQLLCENTDVDFIDINCGCPIDLIFKRGEGSALMGRHTKLEQVVKSMIPVMDVPLTVKMRTGVYSDKSIAHQLIPKLRKWGVSQVTLHGRSREQRYTRLADWDYIDQCAEAASPMPVFGNGDILSYEDAVTHRENTGVSGLMIARGALIKPWIFTEIKEQRHWDISASERLDMLRRFTNAGLEQWGSDQQGISNVRRFLLEWLSFLHRYIPVGILERVPQHINEKPQYYFGRNDLETLMASASCADWVKISEMLLGPVPANFTFLPKHRANSYS